MKNRILGTIVSLLLANAASHAQQVTVNLSGNFPGERNVVDAGGTAANGLVVQVGYFDTTGGFNIGTAGQGSLADLQNIGAHWHQFGSTLSTSHSGLSGFDGTFNFSSSGTSPGSLQIDLWVFNTGGGALQGNFANVTQYGLFTGPSSADPTISWIFPTSPSLPNNTTSISTVDVNNGTTYYGSVVSSANPAGSLQLASVTPAIPEPAAGALLVLGLVLSRVGSKRVRA